MERQVRQAERQHQRLRRRADGEEAHDRERQADRGAGGKQHAAHVHQPARPDEPQRAEREPRDDGDDDEFEVVHCVPAFSG